MGTIILSALVAHTAWHWMPERGELLGNSRSRDRRRVPRERDARADGNAGLAGGVLLANGATRRWIGDTSPARGETEARGGE